LQELAPIGKLCAILKSIPQVEKIEILNTKSDLNRQFMFLRSLEYNIYYKGLHKGIAICLIGLTTLFIGLLFIPDNDLIIKIKAVASILFLLSLIAAFIYLCWFLIQKGKKDLSIKKMINNGLLPENKYSLSFDDQKLIFINKKVKSELSWDYYTFYSEDQHSIYLFPKGVSIYACTSFSENEIGQEAIEKLKKIAKEKLEKI